MTRFFTLSLHLKFLKIGKSKLTQHKKNQRQNTGGQIKFCSVHNMKRGKHLKIYTTNKIDLYQTKYEVSMSQNIFKKCETIWTEVCGLSLVL